MRMFLANLAIAAFAMALSGLWTVWGFVAGFVLGAVLLSLVPRAQTAGTGRKPVAYGVRLWRIIRLLLLFIRELALSAFRVARLALSPTISMRPGLFAYRLTVDRDAEIALLANLITLTPGTLSVDVSADRRILYVHAIDCPDVEAARADIRNGFERAILEAFR